MCVSSFRECLSSSLYLILCETAVLPVSLSWKIQHKMESQEEECSWKYRRNTERGCNSQSVCTTKRKEQKQDWCVTSISSSRNYVTRGAEITRSYEHISSEEQTRRTSQEPIKRTREEEQVEHSRWVCFSITFLITCFSWFVSNMMVMMMSSLIVNFVVMTLLCWWIRWRSVFCRCWDIEHKWARETDNTKNITVRLDSFKGIRKKKSLPLVSPLFWLSLVVGFLFLLRGDICLSWESYSLPSAVVVFLIKRMRKSPQRPRSMQEETTNPCPRGTVSFATRLFFPCFTTTILPLKYCKRFVKKVYWFESRVTLRVQYLFWRNL